MNTGETLIDLLAETRKPLIALQHEQSNERRRDLIEDFMTGIYKLGLLLHQEPSLRSSVEVTKFIQEGQSLLLGVVGAISSYVSTTEHKFYGPWVYDEWTWVSKRRSAIEFLRDLFCDTSFEEFLPYFDTEDIDKMFPSKEEKDGYLPVEAIPEGIPPSHWWWWYPDAPPSFETAERSKPESGG
jgi:hypothetical protein